MEKPKLLIVEDDLDLSEMLNAFFTVNNYQVQTAAWGEDALKMSREEPPDIVMLDIRLPDISGYEVCRQMRQQRRTQDTPILFLTEKRDRVDKLTGLELGVVDYITKPFDIQELGLRVRNVLKRASQQTRINPVTDLPDNTLTQERLNQMLASGSDWAVMLIAIDGLDKLREQFGFVAADEMLRAITLMTRTTVREVSGEGDADTPDFIGHFANTSILVLTTPAAMPGVRERVEERVRYSLTTFYRPAVWGGDGVAKTEDDMLTLKTAVLTSSEGVINDVETLRERLTERLTEPPYTGE